MSKRSKRTGLTRKEYIKLFFGGQKGAPKEWKKKISSPLFKREKARAERIIRRTKKGVKILGIASQFPLSLRRRRKKS